MSTKPLTTSSSSRPSNRIIIKNFIENYYDMPIQSRSTNLRRLQPVAYESFKAQQICDYVVQDILKTFFQQGNMCDHNFQLVVADEDSRYCTIIYVKHDGTPNFVVVVVPKTDPAKRFIHTFKKNNQHKPCQIIVEYPKFA